MKLSLVYRCDVLSEGVKEQLKIQDAKATQLSSYQETLQSTLAWLEAMERSLEQDTTAALTAPQEIRTRLIKYRVRQHNLPGLLRHSNSYSLTFLLSLHN